MLLDSRLTFPEGLSPSTASSSREGTNSKRGLLIVQLCGKEEKDSQKPRVPEGFRTTSLLSPSEVLLCPGSEEQAS